MYIHMHVYTYIYLLTMRLFRYTWHYMHAHKYYCIRIYAHRKILRIHAAGPRFLYARRYWERHQMRIWYTYTCRHDAVAYRCNMYMYTYHIMYVIVYTVVCDRPIHVNEMLGRRDPLCWRKPRTLMLLSFCTIALNRTTELFVTY